MYETYDYDYEKYEEINKGQGEEDLNNGMKKFSEDLDEKHTSSNRNDKKTQNLIKKFDISYYYFHISSINNWNFYWLHIYCKYHINNTFSNRNTTTNNNITTKNTIATW